MKRIDQGEKLSIEEILNKDGCYISTTVGVSMYPMLRNRRDTVIIKPYTGRLKKYDVALYKRGTSYILHRVVKVLEDSYVICGDNCMDYEYGITDDQILGVLEEFYRDDHRISMRNIGYQIYVRLWTRSHLVRRLIKKIKSIDQR